MRASGFLLGVLLFSAAASAQEVPPPSMELLEFLGEWDEADESWLEAQLEEWRILAGEPEDNEESNDDE